jgi:hypothetical protein
MDGIWNPEWDDKKNIPPRWMHEEPDKYPLGAAYPPEYVARGREYRGGDVPGVKLDLGLQDKAVRERKRTAARRESSMAYVPLDLCRSSRILDVRAQKAKASAPVPSHRALAGARRPSRRPAKAKWSRREPGKRRQEEVGRISLGRQACQKGPGSGTG